MKGCPPISFYSPENLEHNLEIATINFLTSETEVNLVEKTIRLSRLFLWYKLDFIFETINEQKSVNIEDLALIQYVARYIRESDEKKDQIEMLLKEAVSGESIKVEYLSYDWQINFKA